MIDFSTLDRHERICLLFSGGKDSLACLYMLRDHLHRLDVIHNDTGDLLPEVLEVVQHARAMCPNFVHLRGDVLAWHREHGLPSDLVPYSASPIGRMTGQERTRIVSRYDCCARNLMAPVWRAVKNGGYTLCIRGTKRTDFPTLPVQDGETSEGVTFWHPLEQWSHAEVFEYLRREGAPIARIYDDALQAPECSRCTAWLNVGQADYLRQHHPERFVEYRARLLAVWAEIDPVFVDLAGELRRVTQATEGA